MPSVEIWAANRGTLVPLVFHVRPIVLPST